VARYLAWVQSPNRLLTVAFLKAGLFVALAKGTFSDPLPAELHANYYMEH
jgi:hypothetical protein